MEPLPTVLPYIGLVQRHDVHDEPFLSGAMVRRHRSEFRSGAGINHKPYEHLVCLDNNSVGGRRDSSAPQWWDTSGKSISTVRDGKRSGHQLGSERQQRSAVEANGRGPTGLDESSGRDATPYRNLRSSKGIGVPSGNGHGPFANAVSDWGDAVRGTYSQEGSSRSITAATIKAIASGRRGRGRAARRGGNAARG